MVRELEDHRLNASKHLGMISRQGLRRVADDECNNTFYLRCDLQNNISLPHLGIMDRVRASCLLTWLFSKVLVEGNGI